MKDLNALEVFVQVCKSQSFTAAAERLAMPKSSVSRAMSSLEGRLGVRLLERTTRRVALTEAGEIYLERCQRVLEEAEQADLAVGALVAAPRGRLRVGAPVIFARVYLGPLLGDLLAAYPDLRVQLHVLGSGLTPPERQLDVLIRPGPLEDSGLLVKPLIRIRLGAFASPRYLEGREPPGSPAALRGHQCITTTCSIGGEPTDSAVWRLRRGAETAEVRVESRVSVPDPGINHQLAVSGAGVALLSQTGARKDVAAGRLVRLLPEWEPEPVELHALYSVRLAASPKVRVFLQFLQSHFDGEALVA